MEHSKVPQAELVISYESIKKLRLEPEDFFIAEKNQAREQKGLFLANAIRNPHFDYDLMDTEVLATAVGELENLATQVENQPLDTANRIANEDVIANYQAITRFVRITGQVNEATSDKKEELKAEWMCLNKELYGEPNPTVYKSLLTEYVQKVAGEPRQRKAEVIRRELLNLLPKGAADGENVARFTPSAETVQLAKRTTEALFGGLLAHIPERDEPFQPQEVRDIFDRILREEFGESANQWRVELDDAVAIKTQTDKKRIVIPNNRKPIKRKELEGLVAHEIGVHYLRSVMAENSSVAPLQLGLSDYLTTEEGLAKVFEQAVKGKYSEPNPNYYIISGLAYFDNKDFRDSYEIMWRLSALKKIKQEMDNDDIDRTIDSSQEFMYRQTVRIFRGTDDLPWFKDLAYYNGPQQVWKYLENFGADYTTLSLMLMGKADPTNDIHKRVLLGSKTVV